RQVSAQDVSEQVSLGDDLIAVAAVRQECHGDAMILASPDDPAPRPDNPPSVVPRAIARNMQRRHRPGPLLPGGQRASDLRGRRRVCRLGEAGRLRGRRGRNGDPTCPPLPGGPVSDRLGPDELRELFLFEKLSDERLAWLAVRGRISSYPAGATVYRAGEPATHLFVLLDGTLSVSVRAGGSEIEMNRTDHRGTYTGAFLAYLDLPIARLYVGTLRAVTGCRFWQLAAADFRWAVREWFPMATHLLQGFAIQGMATQETVSTRERLAALGTVTAGLTHVLNNPAAAAARATSTLHQRLAELWCELAALTSGDLAASQLGMLVALVRQAHSRRAEQAPV